MNVKITATASDGCSVSHIHTIKEEGELTKAIAVVIDDFRKKCGSIYGMTIKVEH